MIKVKCVFKNWQMVVVFFVFIFFLNVFSMFVVPTVPVLRADYFWPGVESGGTFVQMSLVTDHPAGRITALLCSPCFAGPPPPCTLCRAWLRRLSALFFRLPPQCNVWRSNVRYSASREYPGQFLFKTSVWWGWGMRMPRRHCLNRKSQSKDIFSLYAVHWLYKVYIVFSFTWSSYRDVVLSTFFTQPSTFVICICRTVTFHPRPHQITLCWEPTSKKLFMLSFFNIVNSLTQYVSTFLLLSPGLSGCGFSLPQSWEQNLGQLKRCRPMKLPKSCPDTTWSSFATPILAKHGRTLLQPFCERTLAELVHSKERKWNPISGLHLPERSVCPLRAEKKSDSFLHERDCLDAVTAFQWTDRSKCPKQLHLFCKLIRKHFVPSTLPVFHISQKLWEQNKKLILHRSKLFAFSLR